MTQVNDRSAESDETFQREVLERFDADRDWQIDLDTPHGIRDSVRMFRNEATTNVVRGSIRHAWVENGLPNQFAAMFRAAEMEGRA